MGSSKKQTVGYKYSLGMHQILTHGPVDKMTRYTVDERMAWLGNSTGGPIVVSAANLFGGEAREGGVSGTMDLEMGGPTQMPNAYLTSHLGADIPAFRGVVGVVMRQMYLGNNPYLKKNAFRLQRIYVRQDGLEQWNPSKAEVGTTSFGGAAATSLYISLDKSGSMAGTKLTVMKAAMEIVFDQLQALVAGGLPPLNIRIVSWSDSASVITRMGVTVGDFADLRAFVAGITTGGGTNAEAAFGSAVDFFSPSTPYNNVLVCASDGAMSNISGALALVGDMVDDQNDPYSISSGTAVKVRGVGITTAGSLGEFDNSGGPVPVVTGADPEEMAAVILAAMYTTTKTGDMNPAHIIRECLTDPIWGMGYAEEDVSETAFLTAANQLYTEGMGMSLLWDRQMPIEQFVQEIIKHINAALYVARRGPDAGKFILKLIRGNYDPDTLPLFDESNIEKMEGFKRVEVGELTNSVTVNFWDAVTGKTSSTTAQDPALVQQQGAVINTTMQYPGFTNHSLADRAALRDLNSLSNPLASCTIYTNTDAKDLNIGDVIAVSWEDYGLVRLPMRITGMTLGDGKSNRIKMVLSQDAFALPEQGVIVPPDIGWEDPTQEPVAMTRQYAEEASYYELVQQLGQGIVDTQLGGENDLGMVSVAGGRPQSGAINARIVTDAGAGYEDVGALDFCPSALLDGAVGLPTGATTEAWTIKSITDVNGIEVGSYAYINGEYVVVVSLVGLTLTVKRATLDTKPMEHPDNSIILFSDPFIALDPTEYVASDVVNAKLLTVTGQGTLAESSATAMATTLASRAIRPYPAANIQLNGDYFPTAPIAALSLTWSHRNRLQQTGGSLLGWTEPSITPEVGVTYRVIVKDESNIVVHDQAGLTGDSYNVPDAGFPFTSEFGHVTIIAERDGYQSLNNVRIRFEVFSNFGDNLQFVLDQTTSPPAGNAINFVF